MGAGAAAAGFVRSIISFPSWRFLMMGKSVCRRGGILFDLAFRSKGRFPTDAEVVVAAGAVEGGVSVCLFHGYLGDLISLVSTVLFCFCHGTVRGLVFVAGIGVDAVAFRSRGGTLVCVCGSGGVPSSGDSAPEALSSQILTEESWEWLIDCGWDFGFEELIVVNPISSVRNGTGGN